jgi:hypothetical protein
LVFREADDDANDDANDEAERFGYPCVTGSFEGCGLVDYEKQIEEEVSMTKTYAYLLEKSLFFADVIRKMEKGALKERNEKKELQVQLSMVRTVLQQTRLRVEAFEDERAARAQKSREYSKKSYIKKLMKKAAAVAAAAANSDDEHHDDDEAYNPNDYEEYEYDYEEDEYDGLEAINSIVGSMPGSSTDGQGVSSGVAPPTCEDDFKEWVLSQTVDCPRPQRVPGPSNLLEQFTQACEEEGIDASTCMMMGTKRKMEVPKKLVITENDGKEAQTLLQVYSNGFAMKDLTEMLKKAPTKEALMKFRDIVDVKHVNWEAVGTRVWDTFPEPVAAKDP